MSATPAMSAGSDDAGSTVSPPKTARELAAEAYVRPQLSNGRRYFMLTLFCLGEFMDSFIASCLFPAINDIQSALDLKPTEISWTFAAYSTTFSAFLLISGRVSDIYSSRESKFPILSQMSSGRLFKVAVKGYGGMLWPKNGLPFISRPKS